LAARLPARLAACRPSVWPRRGPDGLPAHPKPPAWRRRRRSRRTRARAQSACHRLG